MPVLCLVPGQDRPHVEQPVGLFPESGVAAPGGCGAQPAEIPVHVTHGDAERVRRRIDALVQVPEDAAEHDFSL
ncbi:hypothetical protein MB27_07830 [Actinoplanes utahensis]|uniref:Uncharacterized protein n=1 Tax=Actinoplanes utahensis TaxID=1869 RepID=A0A0A6URE5_ACTUT|nr:hypothetical protein MB27_07830 [Actinoplanes utahensis]